MYAQTEVLPEGETAFVQAMAIERAGDLDRAIKIYYKILTGDPNHQRAYLQLRNIYTRTGDSESAIPIIENWLKYHPEDLQSELILGEFHYRNQDNEKAMEIWDQFRKTKLTNQTTYRLLFLSLIHI